MKTFLSPVSCFQYRPGNAAIVIRRELDDCRLFLADGFMVLFPAEYPYSKMLHKFNPVKAKIEWSNFRARLHSHFISCHEIDNTTFEIWQIHSAFRDCDLDAIIEDYEDTEKEFPVELEKYQPSEMPDASIFAKKYKGNFSPAHNRIEGLSDDAYVEQQLWLFIPLFIWAYNELKRALDVDDKRINELNLWIDSGKKAFRSPQDEMDETQKDLPNKDFTLGTGFELRKRRYWRSFLDSQRSGENVDQETHLPDHVQEQTTPSVAQAHVQTAHCAGAGLTNLPLFGTPQVTGAPQSHVQTAHGAPPCPCLWRPSSSHTSNVRRASGVRACGVRHSSVDRRASGPWADGVHRSSESCVRCTSSLRVWRTSSLCACAYVVRPSSVCTDAVWRASGLYAVAVRCRGSAHLRRRCRKSAPTQVTYE